VGNPEGKRPLGIPRCRLNFNIKMDLRKFHTQPLTEMSTRDRNKNACGE
jgi:hypothetical protein